MSVFSFSVPTDIFENDAGIYGSIASGGAGDVRDPEAADDPDFRSMLAHVVERMDRGFAGLIYAEMKDAVPEASVQFAAQHLSLMLHGLSVRARAGESPDILVELAETAVDRLVPDPASAPVM